MKGLQDILYANELDIEKLKSMIENIKKIYSLQEIDHELLTACSIKYKAIPNLIPLLSSKSICISSLIHQDPEFLNLLKENGIQFIDENKYSISPITKTKIQQIIEEDNVDELKKLAADTDFNFNQMIQKRNSLFHYDSIPIILYCIECCSLKCFDFLYESNANPLLKTQTLEGDGWDGIEFALAYRNMDILKKIQEKGGKSGLDAAEVTAQFHHNEVLNVILSQYKNQIQDPNNKNAERIAKKVANNSLCRSTIYNNYDGVDICLSNGADINFHGKNVKNNYMESLLSFWHANINILNLLRL